MDSKQTITNRKIANELLKLQYFKKYNYLFTFYKEFKIEITFDIANDLIAKITVLNISPDQTILIRFPEVGLKFLTLDDFKQKPIREYILKSLMPEEKEIAGDTYFSLTNGKEMDNQFICQHCGSRDLYYNTSSCDVMDQACEDSVSIYLLVKYCKGCAAVFVKEN